MTAEHSENPNMEEVQKAAVNAARSTLEGDEGVPQAAAAGQFTDAMAPVREAIDETGINVEGKQRGFKYEAPVTYASVVQPKDGEPINIGDVEHSGLLATMKGETNGPNNTGSSAEYVASEQGDGVSVRRTATELIREGDSRFDKVEGDTVFLKKPEGDERERAKTVYVPGVVTKLTGNNARRAAEIIGQNGAQALRDIRTSNDIIKRRREPTKVPTDTNS